MDHRHTNHETKDQEPVKKPWIFCVYKPGENKLISDLRPDCSWFRQSYNVGSRELGSFAVGWDKSGKSNSNKFMTSIQVVSTPYCTGGVWLRYLKLNYYG